MSCITGHDGHQTGYHRHVAGQRPKRHHRLRRSGETGQRIHRKLEHRTGHVVFIIRKDIEKEFKEVIGERIASICSSRNVTVDYAFQDINDIPG